MTAKELEKILKKNGWELNSIRGSHHYYKNSEGRKIPIPFHKGDIPIGTVNAILKQAGLK
ncbi:MAG: type II toxin-antitoxin system HicA family toxin [Bacillota bacterium]